MQPGCSWAQRCSCLGEGQVLAEEKDIQNGLPSYPPFTYCSLLSHFSLTCFLFVCSRFLFSPGNEGFYKETWDSKINCTVTFSENHPDSRVDHVCNDRLLKKEGNVLPKFTGLNLAPDFWAISSVFRVTRMTAIALDKVLTWVELKLIEIKLHNLF